MSSGTFGLAQARDTRMSLAWANTAGGHCDVAERNKKYTLHSTELWSCELVFFYCFISELQPASENSSFSNGDDAIIC